ncbi:MAG: ATP-binding cassette domain-containing protein, partial [bacterium]|nr:ATP-binding cassette domain-containing protein [bacterium]
MKKTADVPIIEVRDLIKSYGATLAVKGISFTVGKGEVVGFLGPNGAGKSTTMKILTGYIPQSSGLVRVLGVDVKTRNVSVRKHIGYLPENNPLYEEMMVMEYLEFVAQMRQIPESKRSDMIDKAIDSCKIESVVYKDIGALSKGYCQRVGLAQAIVHDPQLLILDEPTSGLDPNQIVEIRSLIKDLGKQKTILMSTHILSEAQSTCSRILIVNEGKLVADDSPRQLSMQEGGQICLVILNSDKKPISASQIETTLSQVHGITEVVVEEYCLESGVKVIISYDNTDPREQLFKKVVSANWILLEMKVKEKTLE